MAVQKPARSGPRGRGASRRRRAHRRGLLTGGRGYAALGTGMAALAGGVLAVLPHHSSPARGAARDCGLVNCAAVLPPAVVANGSPGRSPGASPGSTPKPHTTRRAHRKYPKPQHTQAVPAPSPSAPSTPPAPAAPVTVRYTLLAQQGPRVQGQFTITNHTGSVVTGWHLTATLPGDQFTAAWGSAYQASGDTITFDQALLQGGIAPGASLTVGFTASGSTASPASCSFNGAACTA